MTRLTWAQLVDKQRVTGRQGRAGRQACDEAINQSDVTPRTQVQAGQGQQDWSTPSFWNFQRVFGFSQRRARRDALFLA